MAAITVSAMPNPVSLHLTVLVLCLAYVLATTPSGNSTNTTPSSSNNTSAQSSNGTESTTLSPMTRNGTTSMPTGNPVIEQNTNNTNVTPEITPQAFNVSTMTGVRNGTTPSSVTTNTTLSSKTNATTVSNANGTSTSTVTNLPLGVTNSTTPPGGRNDSTVPPEATTLPMNSNLTQANETMSLNTTMTTGSPVSPCAEEPCQNGGTCIPNGTTYVCNCSVAWTGVNCTEGKSIDFLKFEVEWDRWLTKKDDKLYVQLHLGIFPLMQVFELHL